MLTVAVFQQWYIDWLANVFVCHACVIRITKSWYYIVLNTHKNLLSVLTWTQLTVKTLDM